MPRATVNLAATDRIELKTLPPSGDEEGGYVVLRRLTYGQKIQRQQMAMEVSMQAQGGRSSDPVMDMKMTQDKVACFDFGNCVVDHNLDDDSGRRLNFKQPHDVFMLDPRVGEEIAMHIDRMNNLDEATLGNSETGSEPQSSLDESQIPRLNS